LSTNKIYTLWTVAYTNRRNWGCFSRFFDPTWPDPQVDPTRRHLYGETVRGTWISYRNCGLIAERSLWDPYTSTPHTLRVARYQLDQKMTHDGTELGDEPNYARTKVPGKDNVISN